MEKKVSVIIPAYNAESFIEFTVGSALGQTLKEIEVIVVDDCSQDGTLRLLTDRFGNDERVKLIALSENGGVSAARNRGIAEAEGEYIAFLDSDDAMTPDMLEIMYAAAKEHDADVLHTTGCLLPTVKPVPDDMTGLNQETLKPMVLEFCEHGSAVYYAPDDIRTRIDEWCAHRYHWSVWNKLYRTSFIRDNGICFDRLSMAEDMVFCFKAIFLSKRYAVLPGQWYIYRISENSLSRKKGSAETISKLTENQIRAAEAISRFMELYEYFRNDPVERIKIQRAVCNSIDKFYLIPVLEELTVKTAQESETVCRLFEREYGEKAAFVEYLYWRLHELLKGGMNVAALSTNAEELSSKMSETFNNPSKQE